MPTQQPILPVYLNSKGDFNASYAYPNGTTIYVKSGATWLVHAVKRDDARFSRCRLIDTGVVVPIG